MYFRAKFFGAQYWAANFFGESGSTPPVPGGGQHRPPMLAYVGRLMGR